MAVSTGDPAALLRPFVRTLHHYDFAGFPPGEHIGLPSTTVTLIVALDPPLELTAGDGVRRVMTSCLSGLHDRSVTIHHDGVQRGMQAELTPLGLYRLLGVPAGAVSGMAIELDDVLGPRAARTLLDRIAAASDWSARRRILWLALAEQLTAPKPRRDPRPEVSRAWSLLTSSGGAVRVGDVADAVGWSPRHLADQFALAVGLTPKKVGRIARFQRCVPLVRGGHDLADTAARCGFADQAHMTREWAQLAGTSPTRWGHDDVLANVQDRPR